MYYWLTEFLTWMFLISLLMLMLICLYIRLSFALWIYTALYCAARAL